LAIRIPWVGYLDRVIITVKIRETLRIISSQEHRLYLEVIIILIIKTVFLVGITTAIVTAQVYLVGGTIITQTTVIILEGYEMRVIIAEALLVVFLLM